MPELLKMPQVAQVLGVSQRTAERMAADKRIPAINIGTVRRPRYRITDEALTAFLRGETPVSA